MPPGVSTRSACLPTLPVWWVLRRARATRSLPPALNAQHIVSPPSLLEGIPQTDEFYPSRTSKTTPHSTDLKSTHQISLHPQLPPVPRHPKNTTNSTLKKSITNCHSHSGPASCAPPATTAVFLVYVQRRRQDTPGPNKRIGVLRFSSYPTTLSAPLAAITAGGKQPNRHKMVLHAEVDRSKQTRIMDVGHKDYATHVYYKLRGVPATFHHPVGARAIPSPLPPASARQQQTPRALS